MNGMFRIVRVRINGQRAGDGMANEIQIPQRGKT